MEWERQRKEQLMAEKLREYEQLSALKSQTSNLKCELESLVSWLLNAVKKLSLTCRDGLFVPVLVKREERVVRLKLIIC